MVRETYYFSNIGVTDKRNRSVKISQGTEQGTKRHGAEIS